MKRYKNYIFRLFFCICSLFPTSFLSTYSSETVEFGIKPENNIVLLSAKQSPTSYYVVLNEQSPTVSIIENSPPDLWIDFPKIESYFVRFCGEMKISFQKRSSQVRRYTILSRFPCRVLRN